MHTQNHCTRDVLKYLGSTFVNKKEFLLKSNRSNTDSKRDIVFFIKPHFFRRVLPDWAGNLFYRFTKWHSRNTL